MQVLGHVLFDCSQESGDLARSDRLQPREDAVERLALDRRSRRRAARVPASKVGRLVAHLLRGHLVSVLHVLPEGQHALQVLLHPLHRRFAFGGDAEVR